MPFMHHAAPGTMLLTAPELRPEKHLGAGSAVKVSMGVPEIWPLLVVVRGNCLLVSGRDSQHSGMQNTQRSPPIISSPLPTASDNQNF